MDQTTAAGSLNPVEPRIAEASRLATGVDRTLPADFVATLFAHSAAEDLLPLSAQDIAALAVRAWVHLQERPAQTPRILLEAPLRVAGSGPDAPPLAAISVLEIVNDDMPFLLDSVLAELTERGLDVLLVAHPVLMVARDAAGTVTGYGAAVPGAKRESLIHLHLPRIDDEGRAARIVAGLHTVLGEVRVAVADWPAMLARINGTVAALKTAPPPLPAGELAEAVQFLDWLADNNFTFLGIRDYAITPDGGTIVPVEQGALGIMRASETWAMRRGDDTIPITADIRALLDAPQLLMVNKAAMRSRVHRRVYLDIIAIKRFDETGRLIGDTRIVGLFTSTAYTRQVRNIPYLRRKADAVIARAGFTPDSHSGKALANVLDNYPRDELFQIDGDQLYDHALAIMQLDERPRVRVLPRRDLFDRFVAVLVYLPRERYNSRTSAAIGDMLAAAYGGRISTFTPFFTEGPLVRIVYIVARHGDLLPEPAREALEQSVEAIIRTWADSLSGLLRDAYDPGRATVLLARYGEAFSEGYQDRYAAQTAIADIRMMEGLSQARPFGVDFYRRDRAGDSGIGLKIWSHARPIPLSERVPVLENLGFRVIDERTHHIATAAHDGGDDAGFWFHDMLLEPARDGSAFDERQADLETAFLVVMSGGAENDGTNALVLEAGLQWRDVALLRALSRFLRQARISYSQDYVWGTLRNHPAIATQIVKLFHARFDPHRQGTAEERAEAEAAITEAIETALADVASLDEDRILRRMRNAVQAAIRTTYWQLGKDGQPRAEIAIKFESRKLDDLPLPRPLYEIFVYSPRVEGVHLRFGKVARGGLRWSDRPQDFRTEVLGLVKAQQVKNAVIVPVGAKGGFVPKRIPAGAARDVAQAEGVATYKLFIGALLDLTDNILPDGSILPPPDTVRHDGDDPYLVVAADKGTATFSDTANAIAEARGFWLGDAFASGGSAGYDHKKMGITARGAWESVKRHFREMNIDVATTPFTVVGVGDMSGDVFGNGMLRQDTIRLVAAFDHRDIFLDPNPDPATSFAERKRLFDLPRSSWQDYDKALISAGGGVFPRSAKDIALSPEVREVLGLTAARMTPQELMSAILKAPVDLLFFGGIGTYVRASTETDESVGDRTNDAIRIAGRDLACKVVGEGANLGMTQRGRIEAACGGVRLNTDAIDNSAGVNTSDVEVNLKIALAIPERSGALTRPARDELLAGLTNEVAALVLRTNYDQTLALSRAQTRGAAELGFHQRLMQTLEQRGLLDRAVEYLPDDAELRERRRRHAPLTRPELAVLLAYAKLALSHDLEESVLPDDPYLARELDAYFPEAIRQRFPDAVGDHRLRREIVATQLSNQMINRGGPALVTRMRDQTGATPADVAAAFVAVQDSYELDGLNAGIEALDNRISGDVQLGLFIRVQDLLLDRLVWFLRHAGLKRGLAGVVDHFRAGIAEATRTLDTVLTQDERAALAEDQGALEAAGIPVDLARRLTHLPALASAPDIVWVADRTSRSVAEAAAVYRALERLFQLPAVTAAAAGIAPEDYFDRLALDHALDAIGAAVRRLAAAILTTPGQSVESWAQADESRVARVRTTFVDILAAGLTVSKLTVASSLLSDIAALETLPAQG